MLNIGSVPVSYTFRSTYNMCVHFVPVIDSDLLLVILYYKVVHTLLLYTCENTVNAHSLLMMPVTVTRNFRISGKKIRVFNSLNETIGYDTLSNNPCACLFCPDLMSSSFKS